MKKNYKSLFIVDAMALAYKGYYAFINRPLSNSKGEPTSAVFGFVNQLLKILETYKPEYLIVASDSKEKTFRHEKYENYKSSRLAMPEDMIPQINRIKQFVEVLNIPLLLKPGFEADDIIGTLAKEYHKKGFEVYIVSPDKDLAQVITDNVFTIKSGKNEDVILTSLKSFKEEYGFEPINMIDFLALVGDQSDDIPGVKGIGEKTAIPLIQEFGNIENLYSNIDKITKESVKKKLLEGKENAFLSKELATIKLDVKLDFEIESAEIGKPDFSKLKNYFDELEFRNFFNRFASLFRNEITEKDIKSEEKPKDKFDSKKQSYILINDEKTAKELAKTLSGSEYFVFDTETDSLNAYRANLAGVSFSIVENEAYFVILDPFIESTDDLFSNTTTQKMSINIFRSLFKPIFEDKRIKKICQNGKYDIAVLRKYDISVNNFHFDTMIASYILDPDDKHGMDHLSKKYLDYTPIPITEIIGSKKNPVEIFNVEPKVLSDYSCEDADVTLKLFHILKNKIVEEDLTDVSYKIEFPLVEVLEEMEFNGIRIDTNLLKNLSKDLEKQLSELTLNIFKLSGEEFNINSTKQLQKILYEKLQLSAQKKTKTGLSTDAQTLEKLRGEHEIIDLLIDFRQISKLKSTYADSLPNLIDIKTERIHTSYNQTIASTGRLSSIDPNLQNIPIRTELGKEIRKAFIPRSKDFILLSADYSQIELRIMASISGDENLSIAFKNNEDIHRSTAGLVFGVKPEEVTPDMRRKAKEVNFGILYGLGPFGLKTRLGITQESAKEIIDNYFRTFNSVSRFMNESIENARAKGYAETLMKRRRYLRNINSKNNALRQFEERAAINMPIQGTAADLIKLAMIEIHYELKRLNSKSKMLLQVHDELLFDIHKDEVDEMKFMIKEKMENAFPLNVPLLVEIGTGDNWLDAH